MSSHRKVYLNVYSTTKAAALQKWNGKELFDEQKSHVELISDVQTKNLGTTLNGHCIAHAHDKAFV